MNFYMVLKKSLSRQRIQCNLYLIKKNIYILITEYYCSVFSLESLESRIKFKKID